jgi:hypothetical protein
MGQGANITVNNFSSFDIKVDVKQAEYVKGSAGLNLNLGPRSGSKPHYIEYDGITSDGELTLRFTVMKDGEPDPRFTASTASIKLTGKHWERGDDNANGAVTVDMNIQAWQQDLVTIGLKGG